MINVGDRLPDVAIRNASGDVVMTGSLFGEGTYVLFAVPGAFTPTCSETHLPGYVVRADELKAKGVDGVYCIAVNDPFVMSAWGNASGSNEYVTLLADGNGDFADAIGLVLDAVGFGMGKRSQRYAMIIRDGTVTYLGVEAGGEVGPSGADAVLQNL